MSSLAKRLNISVPHKSLIRVRRINELDKALSHMSAFSVKLGKQLLIAFLASFLGAGKDWAVEKGNSAVKGAFSGNEDSNKNNYNSNYNSGYNSNYRSGYNSGYTNNDYSPYQQRSNGTETFPGF